MESKRQMQINELIKRSFSPVFQEYGFQMYNPAFVSVTSVQISPDLGQAKIYLSIFNTDSKEEVLKTIINHTHVLKQALAKRIRHQVRRIPQIYFYNDETVDEMERVDAMFEDIKHMYPPSVQEEE
ncbi:MAG: 30S ribosome-binding factor RbfA [Saprospiraceae bacterium]|nr:30S ribosome-binding factor RbfA [Saprospiraceae bacterium]MCB9309604.1 30S ribosome-binding factor RbfA [Lewinellaceae bacterium]